MTGWEERPNGNPLEKNTCCDLKPKKTNKQTRIAFSVLVSHACEYLSKVDRGVCCQSFREQKCAFISHRWLGFKIFIMTHSQQIYSESDPDPNKIENLFIPMTLS